MPRIYPEEARTTEMFFAIELFVDVWTSSALILQRLRCVEKRGRCSGCWSRGWGSCRRSRSSCTHRSPTAIAFCRAPTSSTCSRAASTGNRATSAPWASSKSARKISSSADAAGSWWRWPLYASSISTCTNLAKGTKKSLPSINFSHGRFHCSLLSNLYPPAISQRQDPLLFALRERTRIS